MVTHTASSYSETLAVHNTTGSNNITPVDWGRCSPSTAQCAWWPDSRCAGRAGRFPSSQIDTSRRVWDEGSALVRTPRTGTFQRLPPGRKRQKYIRHTDWGFIVREPQYNVTGKKIRYNISPYFVFPKVLWRFDSQGFNSVQFSQNSPAVSLVLDAVRRLQQLLVPEHQQQPEANTQPHT